MRIFERNTQGWVDPGDGQASAVREASVHLDAMEVRDGLPFGLRLSIRVGKMTAYAVLTPIEGGRRK